jgi:hypothetical protein
MSFKFQKVMAGTSTVLILAITGFYFYNRFSFNGKEPSIIICGHTIYQVPIGALDLAPYRLQPLPSGKS